MQDKTPLDGRASTNQSNLAASIVPKTPRPIRFAANVYGCDKTWDFEKLATGYQDKTGTLQEFTDHIKQGHAVCAGLLDGKRRSKANVIGSQMAFLDIDNSALLLDEAGKPVKDADGKGIKAYNPQLNLDQALQHPFIQQHCSLIYTSASHKPDWPKFRLVFLLPEFEADVTVIEAMIKLLMAELPHDPACKDACRVFYGNTRAEIPLFNPDVTLPVEWRNRAIASASDEVAKKEQQRKQQETRQQRYQQHVDRGEVDQKDTDGLILDALQHIPPRQPGSGTYEKSLTVLMALVDHFGASEAEQRAEQWSPSIPGTSWNIAAKIKSFKRGGVGIGSLFHIAKQYGWRFPERERIDYQQHEPTISKDVWEYRFGLQQWLEHQVQRFKKHFKKSVRFGSYYHAFQEENEKPIPPDTSGLVEYEPGCNRLTQWAKFQKDAAAYILDASGTGSGKSFDAGMATPELFDCKQAIYISAEHRNVGVPTLKSWRDLMPRHEGLARDEFDKLRRVKKGDPYTIPPNCGRPETLSALRLKNIAGADTSEKICGGCPFFEPCKGGAGTYDYLHARATTISQPRFRAHQLSLPSAVSYDYSEVSLVWDEASEILKTHRSIEVQEPDLNLTIAQLALKAPGAWELLRPLLTALHKQLSGEVKTGRYGLNDTAVRALLPMIENLDIGAITEALKPDLGFLNTVAEHEVDLADLPRNLRKKFSDSDIKTSQKVREQVALNWLPDFLEVLQGIAKGGSLRLQYGSLTITVPDERLVEIARAAKLNIFLDATLTRDDLARTLGVDPGEIVVTRQKQPARTNLEIIQVATLGRLGVGSRRKSEKGEDTFLQQRITALTDHITNTAEAGKRVATIDFKKFGKSGDRSWWVDSRGINDLETSDVLILIGTPCRNLADLEAEFSVLYGRVPTGGKELVKYPIHLKGQASPDLRPFFEMEVSSDPDFREFCRSRILADIDQAIGRLRSGRRPNEQLQVYFIADFPLDREVALRKASDLTPDAASKVERVELAIRSAVQQLKDAGKRITQEAIASVTGYSQQYVSRFRVLLQMLLSPTNNVCSKNIDPPPDPEEAQWISEKYLPVLANSPPHELLEGVLITFEAYGARVFQNIWDATPADAQIKILKVLMFTLNARELESLFDALVKT